MCETAPMKTLLLGVVAAGALGLAAPVASGQTALAQLRSLESGAVVPAQFNPTEIHITKSVPWQKQKGSEDASPALQLSGAEPRTLQAVLLFDAGAADVHELYVAKLEQLAAPDATTKRPPLVQLEWGEFPAFRGVIEKLDTRYTLFLANGTPIRASVDVTLREAASVKAKKGKPGEVDTCETDGQCGAGRFCFSGACAPQP